jgi:hypothetical protein
MNHANRPIWHLVTTPWPTCYPPQPMEQHMTPQRPTYLGGGAYAVCDGGEVTIFTSRHTDPPQGDGTTRHWVVLDADALMVLMAIACRDMPGWHPGSTRRSSSTRCRSGAGHHPPPGRRP